MRHNPTDDELLRSYLLGEIPEEEAERLEQRLLAEDDLFELSEAVEADLLAACDRGELTEEERERVLRRLAASPSGKERLALARALNVLAGNSPAAVLQFRRNDAAPSRPAAFRWAALAAGVLVAAGISWIAAEHRRHGGESAPWIPQERSAPAGPVSPNEAQVPTATPATTPKPVLSVFQLALTSTRGSEAPEKLRIRPGAQVELQISVEGMEGLKSFQLAVRNRKAETVWESVLEPRMLQGVRALVIDLPADQLPPGMYKIEARGLAPGREPEDLSPLDVEVVTDGKR